MKTFNTLDEIFDNATGQITAQQLINERAHICGEWQNIKLSDELKRELSILITEICGGQEKTKSYVKYTLNNSSPQHWGLDRIILSRYGATAKFSYCAGQDYLSELSTIRKFLSK